MTMKQEVKEILSGILVFAIFAVFFSYVFMSKQRYSDSDNYGKYYKISANFQDIEGIGIGSKVRIAGIDVGEVSSIHLSNAFKSQVDMAINKEVKLPEDSAIIVESEGLFGSKYLEILPGAEEILIENGGYISYAQDTIRISNIIERVVEFTKNKAKECNACLSQKTEMAKK